jgi:hypothetical protein
VASAHVRGLVIAGALAALALALGFVTLAMNQTASKAADPPHPVLSLKARHKLAAAKLPAVKAKANVKVKTKARPRPNANVTAAVKAGLPRSLALALGKKPVVVVELTSKHDAVAELAAAEAKAGAALAGAGYLAVNVDVDGGDASTLTRALGKLPTAPAALVYMRPANVAVTLTGFNDRTAVQQAVAQVTPEASGASAAATAQWAAQADAICSKYDSEAQAKGGAVLLLATNLPAIVGIMQKQQTELGALKPPAPAAREIRIANMKMDEALTTLARTKAKTAALVPATSFRGVAALMDQASTTYARYGSTVCAAE